jgi:hypothetical protein
VTSANIIIGLISYEATLDAAGYINEIHNPSLNKPQIRTQDTVGSNHFTSQGALSPLQTEYLRKQRMTMGLLHYSTEICSVTNSQTEATKKKNTKFKNYLSI